MTDTGFDESVCEFLPDVSPPKKANANAKPLRRIMPGIYVDLDTDNAFIFDRFGCTTYESAH